MEETAARRAAEKLLAEHKAGTRFEAFRAQDGPAAIADAYDTITSDRTYKKARSAPDALAELERCGNAQFDGSIVEVFVRTMRTLPNPVIEVAATSASPRTP